MGFAEEVDAEQRKPGSRCKTCVELARMDPEVRAEIEAVINDPLVNTIPIVRALNKRGVDIGVSGMQRHRSKCCGVRG